MFLFGLFCWVYFVTGQSVLSVVDGDTNNGRESLLVCVHWSTLLLGRAFLVWWMETQTMGGNHSSYVYTGLLCYWAERS